MNRKLRWYFCIFLLPNIILVHAQHYYSSTQYGRKEGLNSKTIYKSIILPEGQIYLATNRGLTLFDGHRFISNDSINITTPNLNFQNDKIYFSNNHGLFQLDNLLNSPKSLIKSIPTDSDPNNDHFENIFIDSQNTIWSTDFEHVKYFDPKSKKSKSFSLHPGNKNIFHAISIIETRKNEIWIISPKGIWIWDGIKNEIQPIVFSKLAEKSYSYAILLKNKHLLLATDQGELFEIDPKSQYIKSWESLPENQTIIGLAESNFGPVICTKQNVFLSSPTGYQRIYQIENDEINHLNYDQKTGNIWLSTQNGLIKLQPENPAFTIIQSENSTAEVISIVQSGKGEIWTLNSDGEIWKYTPNSYNKIHTSAERFPYGLSFSKGNLFLSTQNGIFLNDGKDFKKLNLKDVEIKSEIVKTFITPQNELWIVFASHPIQRFNWPDLQKINTPIQNPPEFWSDNKWQDIKIDKNQRIWLVGWMPKSFGITYFDPKTQTFVDISDKKINPQKNLFVGDYFTQIGFGNDKSLYFTAFGGWNKTDENGKLKKRVDVLTYDILNTSLKGIAEDKLGNVFFGTAEGLHIYRKDLDKVFRMTEIDGLPSTQLTHAFTQINSNQIALGIEGGFVWIDMEKALKTPLKNRLEVSQILVNGLPRSLSGNRIELTKDERDLVIKFSDLSFLPEEKVKFRYKFSDENLWHALGSNPEISLNHIQPGEYTLEIEALDNLGNRQSKNLELNILAKPPFTQSYPFYFLLFLVFALLTLLVNRYFWNRKQKEINYLRKIKEAEMTTLRSQMNPHFLFNTLNSINSYIIQNKTDDASNYLTTFSKLMRSILENSKKEEISLQNELETLKLYLELESARLEHSFDYVYKIEEEIDVNFVQVPPLILQPFAENAIWHGLRNLNEKGVLEIIVKQPHEDELEICIVDNGIGREASQKNKKNETQHKSYGIDITLDRIKLLNPENDFSIVDLYDEIGKPAGTKIIIQLKLKEND